MKQPERIDPIHVGLKFNSREFRAHAEISAIRKEQNQLDVIIIPTDGHAWEEKNWDLVEFRKKFEKNIFTEIKPDVNGISIW